MCCYSNSSHFQLPLPHNCSRCPYSYTFIFLIPPFSEKKTTYVIYRFKSAFLKVILLKLAFCIKCWSTFGPSPLYIFSLHVCFMIVSQERKTENLGNHFIAGNFPNDNGWRWNDESWNDMISLTKLSAPRRKTGSLCSVVVAVLSEPWNNDPSLFISVYSVNHNTSEMSLASRRRTIDLVCALPHQQAVTGLHPNWGN